MEIEDLIIKKIKELRKQEQTFRNVGNSQMLNIVCSQINVLMDILEDAELF